MKQILVLLLVASSIALAQAPKPSLTNPASLSEKAPAMFNAKFDTSAGTFVIQVHRDWAPIGADRFYNLVKSGFFDDCRFFRVVPNFIVQFGINGDPAVQRNWKEQFPLKTNPSRNPTRRAISRLPRVRCRTAARPRSSSTSKITPA